MADFLFGFWIAFMAVLLYAEYGTYGFNYWYLKWKDKRDERE